MNLTRRSWTIGALAVLLACLAALFAQPVLLAGAALVGGWLVAVQYRFVQALERANAALSVRQLPAHEGPSPNETTPVTLEATLEESVPLSVDVAAGLPTAATAADRLAICLQSGETDAERTERVSWPVTGRHRFEEATVHLTNGLFEETLTVGNRPTVTVEPKGPREVFVGKGGDRTVTMYGEHDVDRPGSGIEPADVREYVPGDRADRIDWKATARLGTTHIREYDAETRRRTLVVMDHRSSLSIGPPSETKLDHLRMLALATVASANRLGDPISLLAVGDSGITTNIALASAPDQYSTIRQRLLDLEATDKDTLWTRSRPTAWGAKPSQQQVTETERRLRLENLAGDDPYSASLRPFVENRRAYQRQFETKPLFQAVRETLSQSSNRYWTVIFTDDSDLAELQETIALARSAGNTVLVLLAPTVLYEPGGLEDAERAYDRYVTVERRRRRLDRLDDVTVLEVGPEDRLSRLLATARPRGEPA